MSLGGRRKEVSIFNFSFLDILANTIGALVFVLLMVLLNNSGLLECERVVAETKEIEAKSEELGRRLREVQAHTGRVQAEQAQTERDAATAEQQLALERKKAAEAQWKFEEGKAAVSKLQSEAQNLAARKAQTEGEVAELTSEAEDLQRKMAQIEPVKKAEVEIKFNAPVATATKKGGWPVLCEKDRVGTVKSAFRMGAGIYVVWEYTDAGSMVTPGSEFAKMLREKKPADTFIFFVVRPSGFDTYRKAREVARAKKYDCNWEPLAEGLNPVFGGGGGEGGTIQR